MENNVLVSIANVVKETLSYDESLILIGRENATQENFSNNYIVVDHLASTPVSKPKRQYDYDNEVEKFATTMQGTFTLEFYGASSLINHINFMNLTGMQESRWEQKQQGIVIFNAMNSNNRKMTTTSRTYERYEVEIIVQYTIISEVERLRIEEIPTEFLRSL